MDLNRIDSLLRESIENTPFSLEIDPDTLRHAPEEVQQARVDFVRRNPVPVPDDLLVSDVYFKSSHDGKDIRIHVYQPKNFDSEQVVLYFHGGGYVFGLPEQVDAQMFKLALDLNLTILSVDYRLAPTYAFPIPILDGFDALKWLIQEGGDVLQVKTDRISLFGASAGGHLAAAVAQMAVEADMHQIEHQFLLYPVVHNRMDTGSMDEFVDSPLWNRPFAAIAWQHLLGEDFQTKRIKYADLTLFEHRAKLPRTTMVICTLDPLRDEGLAYGQKLAAAGVPTEMWMIPGAVHVFDLFDCPMTRAYYLFLVDRLKG